MLDMVTDIASSVIKCGPQPPFVSLPILPYFLSALATATHIPASSIPPVIFMASTVYLCRLKSKLPVNATGKWCTVHRIAMAALVVACKYLCDGTVEDLPSGRINGDDLGNVHRNGTLLRGFNVPMSNRHWARKTLFFKVQEINLMERELLGYLDFDVSIHEDEFTEILQSHRLYPQLMESLITERPRNAPSFIPIHIGVADTLPEASPPKTARTPSTPPKTALTPSTPPKAARTPSNQSRYVPERPSPVSPTRCASPPRCASPTRCVSPNSFRSPTLPVSPTVAAALHRASPVPLEPRTLFSRYPTQTPTRNPSRPLTPDPALTSHNTAKPIPLSESTLIATRRASQPTPVRRTLRSSRASIDVSLFRTNTPEPVFRTTTPDRTNTPDRDSTPDPGTPSRTYAAFLPSTPVLTPTHAQSHRRRMSQVLHKLIASPPSSFGSSPSSATLTDEDEVEKKKWWESGWRDASKGSPFAEAVKGYFGLKRVVSL